MIVSIQSHPENTVPRESKANLKARCTKLFDILRKTFPQATCALSHRSPIQLLVATILSAQCTDRRVNVVTKDLFKRYRTVKAFAKAPQAELENQIRSTGFYRNKAKNIRAAAAKILSDFGGDVPDNMADLLTLPGVARKTANCVLGSAFGKNEGVVVDTHVKRLSGRLGLSKQKTPEKIELDLMPLFPQNDWALLSHLLIFHGRTYCMARKPNCPDCPLNALCPSEGKV